MRFFLAVLTVAAIGLVAAVGISVAPIFLIIMSFYFYWKAGDYKENLEKEYEEYKEKRREEFCKVSPRSIRVPTWFNQEKYSAQVWENERLISASSDEHFITAFYEIPTVLNNELSHLINQFGGLLIILHRNNPHDEILKNYICKFHNLEFDKWVYLDDPQCTYLPLEEFKRGTTAFRQAKDNIICATITLILGIFCFIFLTIPFLSSIGS